MDYSCPMFEVLQSETFAAWLHGLKDRMAVQRIQARIVRASLGNLGDVKPVGNGVSEMRIDYGPGYRVYFIQQGQSVIVLLAGGDKRTQDADINRAIQIARDWRN